MTFRWSEGKSQKKKGNFRQKIDNTSQCEVCANGPQKNEAFLFSAFKQTKNVMEIDPETGKRQPFEVGAKSYKIDKKGSSPLHGGPGGKGIFPIFADFAPTSKGCRLPVYSSFLSIFFCLFESTNFIFLFVESCKPRFVRALSMPGEIR